MNTESELSNYARLETFCGYLIPVSTLERDEVGRPSLVCEHLLTKYPDYPFVACRRSIKKGVYWELMSQKGGVNVLEIAKSFGEAKGSINDAAFITAGGVDTKAKRIVRYYISSPHGEKWLTKRKCWTAEISRAHYLNTAAEAEVFKRAKGGTVVRVVTIFENLSST